MVDEEKLNRFYRVDWGQVARDLHEINQGIIELEKLAPMIVQLDEAITKLAEVLGVEYEEHHSGSLFPDGLFDLENESNFTEKEGIVKFKRRDKVGS